MRRIDKDGSEYFEIHEVYYTGKKVEGWTQDADAAFGETLEELKEDLERQLRALNFPVLDYETGKEIE